jgi:O-acetyl-ADP-ribose deacetylase (regulator of RNase III)
MIEIIVADITTLTTDAIVNAANSSLAGGGGVDGAIHRRAGPALARAAIAFAPCLTGDAALTPGFNLPARYVIHAVGPVWHGGDRGEATLLGQTYRRAFEVAKSQGDIRSIAFPAISTGAYGYPKAAAAAIAMRVLRAHDGSFERIVACLFDEESARYYHALASEPS